MNLPIAKLVIIFSVFLVVVPVQIKARAVGGVRDDEESSADQDSTTGKPTTSTTKKPPTTKKVTSPRPTVQPEFVLSQVDKIVGNVHGGNIYGIIDESLGIRNTPVQNLVRGILRTVFCNPLQTILNLCRKENGGNTVGNEAQKEVPQRTTTTAPSGSGIRPIGSGNDKKDVGRNKLSSIEFQPVGSG